jgi:hypothetical protein
MGRRGAQQQEHHPPQFSPTQWYYGATHVAAAAYGPIAPFLAVPGTTGELAYGAHHAVGTLGCMLYIGGENAAVAGLYFYTTLGAFAVQRLSRVGRSRPVHSLDGGDSLLGYAIHKVTGRRIGEMTLRGILEPALLCGLGLLAAGLVCPALGVVLGVNAGGLVFVAAIADQQHKAEDRAMRDAMVEVARVTGRWPNTPLGRELARPGLSGRTIAKRVLVACALLVAWMALAGELGNQVEGMKIAAMRLMGRWEPGESAHQVAPAEPYRDELRRRVQRAGDRQDQLRRWRAYNRANGFY